MNKIMPDGNLENIMHRLNGCYALVNALHEIASDTAVSDAALCGVLDLLDGIRRDFRADIDGAEDYGGGKEGAA